MNGYAIRALNLGLNPEASRALGQNCSGSMKAAATLGRSHSSSQRPQLRGSTYCWAGHYTFEDSGKTLDLDALLQGLDLE